MAAMMITAQAVDYDGDILSGAKLNVYEAGTATRRAIYSTNALSGGASSANPAIGTAAGGIAVWVDDSAGDIKVTLTDSAGTTTYFDQDNIDPTNGNVMVYPLGGLDQSLSTSDTPTFAGLTLGVVSFSGVTADPGADRIMFWDDSDSAVEWLSMGTGLSISGNTLSLDGDLEDISGLTPADGAIIIGDGTDFVTESGATARTSLGLGTGDNPTFTNLTLTGTLGVTGALTGTSATFTGALIGTTAAFSGQVTVPASPTGSTSATSKSYVDGLADTIADINAITQADGNIIVSDGTNWVGESGATARASLGLTIGTNVQAYDAGLASIAGLTTSADQMIYTTALDTYATTSLSAFGRSLIDDADAGTARTTLGLGSMATQASTSVDIDGGAIDGTPIGAVSASTGSFTSLNTSAAGALGGSYTMPVGAVHWLYQTGAASAHSNANHGSVGIGITDGGNINGVRVVNHDDPDNGIYNSQTVILSTGKGGVSAGNDWFALDPSGRFVSMAEVPTTSTLPAGSIELGSGAVISQSSENIHNVKAHGAVGDTVVVKDAVTTASDATLTSATAAFTASDVGKKIVVQMAGAGGTSFSDAVMTAGSATLTSVTGPFVVGDVDEIIIVNGAGLNGEPLLTKINAYTDANTVTLSREALTSVSGEDAAYGAATLKTTIATYNSATSVELTVAPSTTRVDAIMSFGTDDTTALTAAWNAATDSSAIFMPPGRYMIDGALPTYSSMDNVTVQAKAAEVFQADETSNTWVVEETCTRINIRDLTIGGAASQRLSGIHMRYSPSNSMVENCDFYGASDFNFFVGPHGAATPTKNVQVVNCFSHDNIGDGFHVGNVDGVVFDTCVARGTGDDSFACVGYENGGSSAEVLNTSFLNCKALDAGFRGFLLLKAHNCSIINCEVNRAVGAGVELNANSTNTGIFNEECVVRNTVVRDAITASGPQGGVAVYYSKRCVIENVHVDDTNNTNNFAYYDGDDVVFKNCSSRYTRSGYGRSFFTPNSTTLNGRTARTSWGTIQVSGLQFDHQQSTNNEAVYYVPHSGVTTSNVLIEGVSGTSAYTGNYITNGGGTVTTGKIGNNTSLEGRAVSAGGLTTYNNN